MKTKKRSLRRYLRYQYLKVLRIPDAPYKIAAGLAIGVFIGIFPTGYLGSLLAIALATLFRVNRVAAVAGTLIMNPFTAPFIYVFSYTLGYFLFYRVFMNPLLLLKQKLYSEGITQAIAKGVVFPYLIGNTILSIILSFLFYWITFRLVLKYKKNRKRKIYSAKLQTKNILVAQHNITK